MSNALLRGSLLTKDLSEIVKADDFILNSEYLQTLLVVIPKYVKEFALVKGFMLYRSEIEFLILYAITYLCSSQLYSFSPFSVFYYH